MSLEPKNRPWWPLFQRFCDRFDEGSQQELLRALDKVQSDRDALLTSVKKWIAHADRVGHGVHPDVMQAIVEAEWTKT